ncbi:hypothetical protein BDF22DRAFT_746120 [Syncephalis plumigaleata]|nr:hypothetical protein BDF22DRAFT_746120 [Syncephalis plumigaleata]
MEVYRLSMLPMDAAYYIPNFITEQEEQQLLKQTFTKLGQVLETFIERVKNTITATGGIPDQRGMLVEPLPDWLTWPLKRMEEMQWSYSLRPLPLIIPHEDGPMYLPCVATLSLDNKGGIDSFSLFLEPRSLFIQRDQSTKSTCMVLPSTPWMIYRRTRLVSSFTITAT